MCSHTVSYAYYGYVYYGYTYYGFTYYGYTHLGEPRQARVPAWQARLGQAAAQLDDEIEHRLRRLG